MIGATIESKASPSVAAKVFLLIAILLAAATFATDHWHWLIVSLLPFSLWFFLWINRINGEVFVVEASGLRPMNGTSEIAYSEILHVEVAPLRSQNAVALPHVQTVTIVHRGGETVLYNLPSAEADDLLRLIQQRLPPNERVVPPYLLQFVQQQQAKFAADYIHIIHALKATPATKRISTGRAVAYALLSCGVIWLIIGIVGATNLERGTSMSMWIASGFFVILIGLIALFSSTGNRRIRKKLQKSPDACIVVSPQGLAMVQGETRGKLAWDEVVGTKMGARFLDSPSQKGLQVLVRGGQVVIDDIYEHPLKFIEELIQRNMRGPS